MQKDFDQATAALERSRQIHAVDREQIMRMEEELKAFSENEKQIMLIQVLQNKLKCSEKRDFADVECLGGLGATLYPGVSAMKWVST